MIATNWIKKTPKKTLQKTRCFFFYRVGFSCFHDEVLETLAGLEKKMVVKMSSCRSFALERLKLHLLCYVLLGEALMSWHHPNQDVIFEAK